MYLVYGSISGLVTILQALANLRLDSHVCDVCTYIIIRSRIFSDPET